MATNENKKTSVRAPRKTTPVKVVEEKLNPVLSMLQLAMTDSNVDLDKMEKIMRTMEVIAQVNGSGRVGLSGPEKEYGNTGPMKKALVTLKMPMAK